MLTATTLIKLMVLMILGNADYPLSTATLYEFFLETRYARYFDLNKTIYKGNNPGLGIMIRMSCKTQRRL